MKVYVLTRCAAEENYTPRVFATKKQAKEAMEVEYNELVDDKEYVQHCSISNNRADIVYDDDTYDVFQIFETAVYKEKKGDE